MFEISDILFGRLSCLLGFNINHAHVGTSKSAGWHFRKNFRSTPVILTGIPAHQMPPSFICMPEDILV